jgi:hypothetical protein
MTEEQIALAKRAVACKGWRWMPGMLHGTVDGGELKSGYRVGDLTLYVDADRLPVLEDPATLGCLLALVREAWGDLHMVARCDDRHGKVSWWICRWGDLPRSRECSTEAEALVAALEGADTAAIIATLDANRLADIVSTLKETP